MPTYVSAFVYDLLSFCGIAPRAPLAIMAHMACFLALRPADHARDRLADIAARLQQWGLSARWCHRADYHLTLSYLGDLDEHERAALPWVIADAVACMHELSFALPGLGAFAGKQEPRVVYAAVDDATSICAEWHEMLADMLGQPAEKHFHPHVTLCRPKPGRSPGGRCWPQLLDAFGQAIWGECTFSDLVLYSSEYRGEEKPRYRVLESWTLPPAIAAVG